MAQLSIPDMRIPIAYALSYPERLQTHLKPLNLKQQGELTFLSVEKRRFPALDLAYKSLALGGTIPPVLNAANEIAVDAFLNARIDFRQIHRLIEKTLGAHTRLMPKSLADILEADRWARGFAERLVA